MSRNTYRTIDDVLRSPWAERQPTSEGKTERVFRSTKLEDSIYADLRKDDNAIAALEEAAQQKLHSFPALSRDVYQAFYSLLPKRNEEERLSGLAQRFNLPILNQMLQSESYPTLKTVCEGRELPAYEAAAEFTAQISDNLNSLMEQFGGGQGALQTLEKLQNARDQAADELSALLQRLLQSKERNETLEQAAVDAANKAESKQRQVDAVSKMADATAAQHKDEIALAVSQAAKAASERAEEVQNIIGAWSDAPGNMERTEPNLELLNMVRQNQQLQEISRYLGRFRELFAKGRKNAYAYGRGENYSLELGNDLSRVITSEFAMLASSQTMPLFLRKYQQKQLKQYRRREPICKGMGDIICCLDESGSTRGDAAAWGKAVALTLLEIAAENGRNFALIHFSGPGCVKADLFRPGEYTVADKLSAAQTFLDGGTDFETPMTKAVDLMEHAGFENADIVFITDGECAMSDEYLEQLRISQQLHHFSITGILLDDGFSSMDFSLKDFCQDIFRTSELMGDEIVKQLLNNR